MRKLLKSKIDRAVVTESNVDYEGSIGIDKELMDKVDLWENEKVLVISNSSGERLETYVIPEEADSGRITINGGAAKKIDKGEKITIISFTSASSPHKPKKILVDENNEFLKTY